jgi:translation initiation factor IF-2
MILGCPPHPYREHRLSNTQTKEKDKKVRVFELAKELALGSKDLVALAKDLGFAGVTNQLSGLTNEQVDALKDRAKKGPRPGEVSRAAPPKPIMPPAAKLDSSIKTLPKAVRPAPVRQAPAAVEADLPPVVEPAAEERPAEMA